MKARQYCTEGKTAPVKNSVYTVGKECITLPFDTQKILMSDALKKYACRYDLGEHSSKYTLTNLKNLLQSNNYATK